MTIPTYDLSGYKNYIKMSGRKRILVEGIDDKRLFKILFNELSKNYKNIHLNNIIDIDTAERLSNFGKIIGNKDKVIEVCQNIINESYANRIVGFIDRDFQEFDLTPTIVDKVNIHQVIGRLIISRGHSIENYFFDFDILKDPLINLSLTEYFDEALKLFQKVFYKALVLACATSIATFDFDKNFSRIKSSIDFSILEISDDIHINKISWEKKLKKSNYSSEDTIIIQEKFNFWLEKVNSLDREVIRWICHGHIGFKFLWAAYAQCIFTVCQSKNIQNPTTYVQKVLSADESLRLNVCAHSWAKIALGNNCDYPIEILRMLDIHENTRT